MRHARMESLSRWQWLINVQAVSQMASISRDDFQRKVRQFFRYVLAAVDFMRQALGERWQLATFLGHVCQFFKSDWRKLSGALTCHPSPSSAAWRLQASQDQ